jgi:hypothetical protein
MQGHTSASATYRENDPPFMLGGPTSMSGHSYSQSAFRCHDFAPAPVSVALHAGGTLDLEWLLEANHPGDWFATGDRTRDVARCSARFPCSALRSRL